MSRFQVDNKPRYWLIEPEATAVLSANPRFHGFAFSFFNWLAGEVSERLDLSSGTVRLEVIEANYLGAYPCLAASNASGEISDADAKRIEAEIRDLIQKTTLDDFLQAMSSQVIPAGP